MPEDYIVVAGELMGLVDTLVGVICVGKFSMAGYLSEFGFECVKEFNVQMAGAYCKGFANLAGAA